MNEQNQPFDAVARFKQKSKMPPFACPRQVRGRYALGVGGIGKSRIKRERPKRL
jgi:hypothetical protein